MISWLKNIFKRKQYSYLVCYTCVVDGGIKNGMTHITLSLEWGLDDHIFFRNFMKKNMDRDDVVITSVMPIKNVYNSQVREDQYESS